jgi:hypothetical protein
VIFRVLRFFSFENLYWDSKWFLPRQSILFVFVSGFFGALRNHVPQMFSSVSFQWRVYTLFSLLGIVVTTQQKYHVLKDNIVEYYISNSNCPIKKQHLYHVTMWFFTVFHSNSWFCNAAWDTIISHNRSTVGYHSSSRVTRGHHALKQYGVRELLFVISYRRFIHLS